MQMFAKGSAERNANLIIIGDTKSPDNFNLNGANYYSVTQQIETLKEFASSCPTNHYARKNIGYLLAIRNGAKIIVDTDDDNLPYESFWEDRHLRHEAKTYDEEGWLNVYKLYSKANIWPRGLPLNEISKDTPNLESLKTEIWDCPIQQGLANENPDVDAVYRLTLPLPQNFNDAEAVVLKPKAWCPFNSQNTTWFEQAFPLLYLPAYCSFRMTDIWRSFVAQRIATANGWPILFHKATVWQERNEHNLMKDFADEIPGYLHNSKIKELLEELKLTPGTKAVTDNLKACYTCLVAEGLIGDKELPLLDLWLSQFS